jgi:hypothetical protein
MTSRCRRQSTVRLQGRQFVAGPVSLRRATICIPRRKTGNASFLARQSLPRRRFDHALARETAKVVEAYVFNDIRHRGFHHAGNKKSNSRLSLRESGAAFAERKATVYFRADPKAGNRAGGSAAKPPRAVHLPDDVWQNGARVIRPVESAGLGRICPTVPGKSHSYAGGGGGGARRHRVVSASFNARRCVGPPRATRSARDRNLPSDGGFACDCSSLIGVPFSRVLGTLIDEMAIRECLSAAMEWRRRSEGPAQGKEDS